MARRASSAPRSIERSTASRSHRTDSQRLPSEAGGGIVTKSSAPGSGPLGLTEHNARAAARSTRDGNNGSAFTTTARVAPLSGAAHNDKVFSSPPSTYSRPATRTGGKPTGTGHV